MNDTIKHVCPKCSNCCMEKMIIKEPKEPYTIHDPSTIGVNVSSVTYPGPGFADFNATSGYGIEGKSGTNGFGPSTPPDEAVYTEEEIILIPYECPNCGYQESFDE